MASSKGFKSDDQQDRSNTLELLEATSVQNYDLDFQLRTESDYTTTSDDTDDDIDLRTGRTEEVFSGKKIPEPLTERSHVSQSLMEVETYDDNGSISNDLVLLESTANQERDESEVDSEEERDIMREIKDEITENVRTEMDDELQLYRGVNADTGTEESNKEELEDEFEGVEPKLKAAILKMRKLDRILAKKIKKEREVKRDRIMLMRKLRAELTSIKPTGREEQKEVQTNTSKFLSLTLPATHNDVDTETPQPVSAAPIPLLAIEYSVSQLTLPGVLDTGPEDRPSPPVSPVFQTQIPMDDDVTEASSSIASSRLSECGTATNMTTSSSRSQTKQRRHGAKKRRNRDFIKRNVELASDAANTIPMTDDEKSRIKDLLNDIDTLPDIPETDETLEENPYQIVLSTGEGFLPTQEEMRRLEAIDDRLRALMPAGDFDSIASVPHSSRQAPSRVFTRTGRASEQELDTIGEAALRDTKEHRDLQERLRAIETELAGLTTAIDHEMESPTLSEGQLNDLLDQCSRAMSRVTEETDSLALSSSQQSLHTGRSSAQTSSRSSLYDNPPTLPDDVLQQLLAEARAGGATHRSDGGNNEPVLESINEETLRELLRDSRTTSRASLRSSGSRACSARSSVDEESHVITSRPSSRSHLDKRDRLAGPDHAAADPDLGTDRPVPFLPDINPRGFALSTQPLNNSRDSYTSSARSRSRNSAVTTVHNSLHNSPEPHASSRPSSFSGTTNI